MTRKPRIVIPRSSTPASHQPSPPHQAPPSSARPGEFGTHPGAHPPESRDGTRDGTRDREPTPMPFAGDSRRDEVNGEPAAAAADGRQSDPGAPSSDRVIRQSERGAAPIQSRSPAIRQLPPGMPPAPRPPMRLGQPGRRSRENVRQLPAAGLDHLNPATHPLTGEPLALAVTVGPKYRTGDVTARGCLLSGGRKGTASRRSGGQRVLVGQAGVRAVVATGSRTMQAGMGGHSAQAA